MKYTIKAYLDVDPFLLEKGLEFGHENAFGHGEFATMGS